MENYRLKSVFFKNLKGLKDAQFVFEKPLTAIMGVNGSGKTTVIHALACAYQPPEDGKGENHKFSDFFVPNTDALWQGSEFFIINEKEDRGRTTVLPARKYGKAFDRWSPRYGDRPKRNIYYIGIDSCLPEIEKKSTQNRIIYSSCRKEDRLSRRVIRDAAVILNKNYQALLDNTFNNKHFNGVELDSGLKYSSLSMGTGEQRTIKILEKIFSAEPFSLILIDEIDLLLHVSSLKKLICRLDEIARDKKLQIVFTTHALEMIELTQYVGIQYISNITLHEGSSSSEKTIVYNTINSDLIYSLTGSCERPLKLYVEDELAKAIVKKELRTLNISGKAEVIKYGAIENAFTLAAAKVLAGEDCTNTLILLDGDRYRTAEERLVQIRKRLSGTEADVRDKWDQALSLITAFRLPIDTPPEKFFHDLVIENGDRQNELVIAASEIQAVSDTHEWLYNIQTKLNDTESNVVRDIIDMASNSERWNDYIQPVSEWLSARKAV